LGNSVTLPAKIIQKNVDRGTSGKADFVVPYVICGDSRKVWRRAMFSEMRRKDRAMLEDETDALLKTAQVGTLATVSEDNTPYVVPMNFVYTKGVIYLHSAVEGKKLDNIVKNSSICFNVIDAVELMPAAFATKYKSATVFGKIAIVEDPEEKRQGLIAVIQKYSPDFYESGLQYIDKAIEKTKVLRIEVSKITGKARV